MGRSIERLSALQVERLSRVPGMHCDGGGLYLRVTSKTSRSWVYRFMLGGRARREQLNGLLATGKPKPKGPKATEIGFGPFPEITLADAREKAAQARRLKALGKDPKAEREALRAAIEAEQARAITFKQCAERYIDAHKAGWRNSKHAKQWSATLETYAYPVFGHLPVSAIDVPLVTKVLEPIWSTKPETASRVRGRVESILDWATIRGHRTGENPARWRGHLESVFPARTKVKQVQHHAALAYRDVPGFVAALKAQAGTGALALQFAILTAARTGEILFARWNEIDWQEKVWNIPAERMKGKRPHRVPLTRAALDILEMQKKATGGDGFIFPGAKRGKPLSNMSMLQTLRRMKRGDLTAHGFRSSFRDWAAEQTGFPGEVAEAALAHIVGDKVEAAYRRGDLFEKRRKLMTAWATFSTTPSATGTVIPIRHKA